MAEVSKEMKKCVKDFAKVAAGTGVVMGPIPHSDIAVMIGLWAAMLKKLVDLSDNDYDEETLQRVAVAAVIATGTAAAAIKTVSWATSLATAPLTLGLSLLFNSGVNGAINYWTTRATGMESAELIVADELTPENAVRAALAVFGIRWKGWGSDGPPDPSDYI